MLAERGLRVYTSQQILGSWMWVHVPEDADAGRAVRGLADHQVLHFRHYGHGSQQDLHIG